MLAAGVMALQGSSCFGSRAAIGTSYCRPSEHYPHDPGGGRADQCGQLRRRAGRTGGRDRRHRQPGVLSYSYLLSVEEGYRPARLRPSITVDAGRGVPGFLPHNFYPARIFMGDSGSMLIGLLLAASTISLTGLLDPNAVGPSGFVPGAAAWRPLLVTPAATCTPPTRGPSARLMLVRAEAETGAAQLRPGRRRRGVRCSSCAVADGDRLHETDARRRLGQIAQMQGDLAYRPP